MLTLIRRISLTQWIMVSIVIGILVGWLAPEVTPHVQILSNIFLRMIKSVIVPIIFGTLVLGIAGHSDDLKAVGRLAFRSLLYFEVVTTLALVVGLVAVNLLRPGDGISLAATASTGHELAAKSMSPGQMFEHVVPQSFIQAAAANDVLQVVFFSLLFGFSLAQLQGQHKQTMLELCEALSDTMFKFTGIVMKFAPIGVGAAMAYTVGHSGLGVLLSLGKLVLTLYAALFAFVILVFVPIMIIARIPVRRFLLAIKDPALVAFSTTSSDAALPQAIQRMIDFGVPKRVVSFVMPLGYSFNLDGSTLHLAVASIFVAQAAGIQLGLSQQLLIMLTLILTSKGVAAVPRATLVILSGTLVTFDLPLEGVAVLLGVDSLMDMGRTTVNLVGNCLASAVMARWEGELPNHPDPTS